MSSDVMTVISEAADDVLALYEPGDADLHGRRDLVNLLVNTIGSYLAGTTRGDFATVVASNWGDDVPLDTVLDWINGR